jgi:L-fuconolactonase
MIIDAHQHFWRLDRGDYGWLTADLAPIHRDFGPADLAPTLSRHGIDATIVVQAAPTVAETEYLLALAASTPYVAGVVGWADFESPRAVETIARLASDPLLVGLRPMVQDIDDVAWLARSHLAPAFAATIAHGLVFDALVKPQHLPQVATLLERHPSLAVVVDHGAKPDLHANDLASWRHAMAAVAAFPRAACKLSGLVTEAPPGASLDTLRPVIDTLIDLFGPYRLVWGSDWPVVELAGGYDRWRAMSLQALAPLTASERAHILGGNAQRIYLARRSRPDRG